MTAPAIALMWSIGTHSTGMDIFYTILLIVAGMADNVLKPLLLGRGVDAPMPVVLLGALGGMASNGILGMFLGATLLAIGYRIFMTGSMKGNPPCRRINNLKGALRSLNSFHKHPHRTPDQQQRQQQI